MDFEDFELFEEFSQKYKNLSQQELIEKFNHYKTFLKMMSKTPQKTSSQQSEIQISSSSHQTPQADPHSTSTQNELTTPLNSPSLVPQTPQNIIITPPPPSPSEQAGISAPESTDPNPVPQDVPTSQSSTSSSPKKHGGKCKKPSKGYTRVFYTILPEERRQIWRKIQV